VMAAMDAADAGGGDSRCSCRPTVADSTSGIPCTDRTAYVAYITVAERNDTNGDSHNNGKYSMYIAVSQPNSASPGAIKPGENLNPVKTLRMRYDKWRATQPSNYK
jgi:hypothetical protein